MSRPILYLGSALVFAFLGTGCASIHKDSGFGDVQSAVRDRTGMTAHWEQQTAADRRVDEEIDQLLSKELTPDSVVEVTLLNSRRLQGVFEQLGIARADLLEARTIRNPILGAEVRFPGSPLELSITQIIMDLVTLRRRAGVASANLEATKQHVADEVLRTIADVRTSFYLLQAASQSLQMHEMATRAAKAAAELAIRQHEAGNISALDLETEQAMFAESKLELARSEGELEMRRERLNVLMGLWGPRTSWTFASFLPEIPHDEIDLGDLESLAVARRLDLASARQKAEAAARAVGLARPEAIGELSAGWHREREPEGRSTTGPSVDIPLPILNRGTPRKLRAEAELRQALDHYAALAVEVRSEARSAGIQLRLARTQAEYYRDVLLPRRARIVSFSQQHYNYMLVDAFRLLSARKDEIKTRGEYIRAQCDYWIARTELERAVGGSLPSGGHDK